MWILGIMRVRNGESTLASALDSLAKWCDEVYVLDDRSTDRTAEILAEHPIVTNVFRASDRLPQVPWEVDEATGLALLYRMTDFCRPDWVVAMDDDSTLKVTGDLRDILGSLAPAVVGVRGANISLWHDEEFPKLIPVMGTGIRRECVIWRYKPGLRPGMKPLHNGLSPANLEDFGESISCPLIEVLHGGWDTLAKRVDRVRLYRGLDPKEEYNWGVPYDRSLLFGYEISELDQLKKDYNILLRAMTGKAGSAKVCADLSSDPTYSKVIKKTIFGFPPAGETRWSVSSLAAESGLSERVVAGIWNAAGLDPMAVETWKLLADRQFSESVRRMLGVFLVASGAAMVLELAPARRSAVCGDAPDQQFLSDSNMNEILASIKTLLGRLQIEPSAVRCGDEGSRRDSELLDFFYRTEASSAPSTELHVIASRGLLAERPGVAELLRREQPFRLHMVPTFSSWLSLAPRWSSVLAARSGNKASQPVSPSVGSELADWLVRGSHQDPFVYTMPETAGLS